MLRSLMLAIPASLIAVSFATAQAVVVHDEELAEQFEVERQIVEMSQEAYGPTAVYDNGQQIPRSLDEQLVPRQALPAAAPVAEIPVELAGRLPQTEPDTQWVRIGEHLLEVRPDRTIVMGVYDVLP